MRTTGITDYHAKYLAAKIRRKAPLGSFERLIPVIYDSDIPLFPHQVAAADFIHNSPSNSGVILADEMGLGKTIEAGLGITRVWNEGYRQVLVIVPITEQKMWQVTLQKKFGLPVEIYNYKKLRQFKRRNVKEPFKKKVIKLCTYMFAYENEAKINEVNWDLVVVDQAHRIENVYDIRSEVGDIIRGIVWGHRNILITSNPFQSTMKRLFKLGNLVDKYAFGDRRSYNYQFVSITDDIDYRNLAKRLEPIMKRSVGHRSVGFVDKCKRTEIPILYKGNPKEVDFIVAAINYYINTSKFGLPNEIASMPALGLFIQMSTSPKIALGGIGLIDEALRMIREGKSPRLFLYRRFKDDIEFLDWVNEEWLRNKEKEKFDIASNKSVRRSIDNERKQLLLLREYALEIRTDTRFKNLLSAIDKVKKLLSKKRGSKKLVIYTQSKQAQKYLVFLLREAGFRGVYYVNQKNDTRENEKMYEAFIRKKTNALEITGIEDHDRRTAVIREFEQKGTILVATDKGMQDQILHKCSAVINYDIPFDPSLTDLRFKRVQGYMKNGELLIVNIVNESNEMELWNYTKQRDVFDMFHGKYGRSDVPVGAIGVGSDYAMLVFGYYMQHHTIHLVDRAFRKLEIEIKDAKSGSMNNYYKKLVEMTAQREREEGQRYLDLYESQVVGMKDALMQISAKVIEGCGSISARGHGSVSIRKKPFRMKKEDLGIYSFDEIGMRNRKKFYVNRGIGKVIVDRAYKKRLTMNHLKFSYASVRPRLQSLTELKGKTGILNLRMVTIEGLQTEQYLLFSGVTEDGDILTQRQCHDLMKLRAKDLGTSRITKKLNSVYNRNIEFLMETLKERDQTYIREISRKLDMWIEDKVLVHKKDLRLIMIQKRKLHRRWVNATSEKKQNKLEMDLLEVGVFRRKKRRYIRKIRKYSEIEKVAVLKKMKDQLNYKVSSTNLFTIKWEIGR